MNEASQPTTVTVRALLTHFHSILDQVQRTSEPVTPAPAAAPTGAGAGVIALRGRLPAGVLLGYETWQAGQAELAAARQRVTELEAQLARPQLSGEVGATWRVTPASAASANSPETGLSWGSTTAPTPSAPPVTSGWGRSGAAPPRAIMGCEISESANGSH